MRHGLSILGVLLVALAGSCPAGAAVTYHVNSNDDKGDANPGDGICQTASPGECTLRAAIQEANVGGGVISVPAFTIAIATPLVVTHTMTIEGAGVKATDIDANLMCRIFIVSPPPSTAITLTVRDTTLSSGASGDAGGMAVVSSAGTLVLERCLVTSNRAILGAAVSCDLDSALTIRDSELSGNHSVGGNGGAVAANRCVLNVSGTSFHDNTAALGGALFVINGSTGQLSNTTIGLNTADQAGGGIIIGGAGSGVASLTLYNTTVAANTSSASAGGGIKVDFNGSVTLQSSILAYNLTGTQFMAQSDCVGPMTSTGNNIVTYTGGGCVVTGAVSTDDPLLGDLRDNGGRGPTFALLSGSPAIDGGPLLGCFAGPTELTTDQRGAKRVIGARCDTGAYERGPCGDVNGDGTVDLSDVFFLINFLFAGGPLPPGLANVDGDQAMTVGDVFFLLNRLFASGPAPSCPGT
jgi:CSLREA domain-containing protein